MKVHQTSLVTPGPALGPEVVRSARVVDVGESNKKAASETQRDPKLNMAQVAAKPIVVENAQVRLRFDQDKETGIHLIQVVDAESGKLVRQIPPEELLNVIKALRDIKGLMVSKEI
jgi:flagellar protein FlaG